MPTFPIGYPHLILLFFMCIYLFCTENKVYIYNNIINLFNIYLYIKNYYYL